MSRSCASYIAVLEPAVDADLDELQQRRNLSRCALDEFLQRAGGLVERRRSNRRIDDRIDAYEGGLGARRPRTTSRPRAATAAARHRRRAAARRAVWRDPARPCAARSRQAAERSCGSSPALCSSRNSRAPAMSPVASAVRAREARALALERVEPDELLQHLDRFGGPALLEQIGVQLLEPLARPARRRPSARACAPRPAAPRSPPDRSNRG